jgi:hypothetical protein
MNHQGVTEVVLFKLQEGISDEAFVRAANALMPDLTAMPGFIRRELGKDQDGSGWIWFIGKVSSRPTKRPRRSCSYRPASLF